MFITNPEIETLELTNKIGNSADFVVKRIETIYDINHGVIDTPHRHNYYTLILVEKGTGEHIIDFKTYPVSDFSLHVVYPGQVHCFNTNEKPKGWVLNFTSEFLLQNNITNELVNQVYLYNTFGDSPPLPLNEHSFDKFKNILQQIEEYTVASLNYQYDALGALLKLIFIGVTNLCSVKSENPLHQSINESNILVKFKKLIDKNYTSTHKVSDYANALAISADYLNKYVKNQVGKSAKELIQDRLIVEAKRMLIFSDKTNKELAYELGFEEPAHFSNFFKKLTQMTPKQFKLNNQ